MSATKNQKEWRPGIQETVFQEKEAGLAQRSDDGSVTGFLTYRIARLHFALNAQAVAILRRGCDLSLSQWRVLAVVGSDGPGTIRDCVRQTGMDPSVFSRAVASLESRGLIVTSRSGSDRRVLQVRLSDAGRSMYERMLPRMRQRQQKLLDELGPEEGENLARALNKLEAAAGLARTAE